MDDLHTWFTTVYDQYHRNVLRYALQHTDPTATDFGGTPATNLTPAQVRALPVATDSDIYLTLGWTNSSSAPPSA